MHVHDPTSATARRGVVRGETTLGNPLTRLVLTSAHCLIVIKVVCKNAENKTSTTMEAVLLTQRKSNFFFVLDSCLRAIYGSALRRVESFATDGDSNLYSVVDGLQGKYGMSFHRVLCRWHAIVKPFMLECSAFCNADGGVALSVLDQVRSNVSAPQTHGRTAAPRLRGRARGHALH